VTTDPTPPGAPRVAVLASGIGALGLGGVELPLSLARLLALGDLLPGLVLHAAGRPLLLLPPACRSSLRAYGVTVTWGNS